MSSAATNLSPIRHSTGSIKVSHANNGDDENEQAVDVTRFVSACTLLGEKHQEFAALGVELRFDEYVRNRALEMAIPVLEDIATDLKSHASGLAQWTIESAGRNEVIKRDIDRNWQLLKALGAEEARG